MNRSNLHGRRLLLENPYAHIEQLDLEGEGSIPEAIRVSRKLLEDPYAHIDGDGGFSALDAKREIPSRRWSFEEVERVAIDLQRRLWKARHDLWDGHSPSPVEVLDVAKAAKLVGFDLKFVGSLGIFVDRSEKVSVAGMIDRPNSSISVSGDFPWITRNFTAAHELGHALLHQHLDVVHRDRPLDGSILVRDRIELEADKFAVYFLMPEKLVRREFSDRFLTGQFVVSEETAFALSVPAADVGRELGNKHKLARVLASATHYNGRHFYSLAEIFGVTIKAMAIRLEELRLV